MNEQAAHDESAAPVTGGVFTRVGTAFLWYGLPGLTVLAVGAYIAGAVIWHANPPIVPVAGISMKPTLQPGDLVIVKGVETAKLKKGDVIALRVPKSQQTRYGAPPAIVHRIAEVKKDGSERLFKTKGDNNPALDAFDVRPNDVIGVMVARGPGLGYPFLFFRSRQGKIFLLSVLAVFVLYFGLAFFDKRRELSEINTHALAQIFDETRALKESMESGAVGARAPPAHSGADLDATVADMATEGVPGVVPVAPGSGPGERLAEFELAPAYREEAAAPPAEATAANPTPADLDRLEREIHAALSSTDEVKDTMRELVGAIGEYGEHLRSHTAVMQSLAASTGELQEAASEMRQLLASLTQVVLTLAEKRPDGTASP